MEEGAAGSPRSHSQTPALPHRQTLLVPIQAALPVFPAHREPRRYFPLSPPPALYFLPKFPALPAFDRPKIPPVPPYGADAESSHWRLPVSDDSAPPERSPSLSDPSPDGGAFSGNESLQQKKDWQEYRQSQSPSKIPPA